MFKKFIVCDCFLEIAYHCLSMNANFGEFKECASAKRMVVTVYLLL